MAEIDPYATLGVPRTASRDEIARAYRRLAKRHHPDAGAPPSPTMSRINEAWHILSDVNRRARWDRLHAPILGPHWAPAPAPTSARVPVPAGPRAGIPIPRPPAPPAPATFRDSPWMAVAAVGGALVVLLVAVLAVALAGGFAGDAPRTMTFTASELRMEVPEDWRIAVGETPSSEAANRVIAHVVSFPVNDNELCTTFVESCALAENRIPVGEASVVIVAWNEGEPPVPEPVTSRPAGLDADRIIGGRPAAFELRSGADYVAWWQLSPPGFPDRWIEITARIGGRQERSDAMLATIDAMIESIEFEES